MKFYSLYNSQSRGILDFVAVESVFWVGKLIKNLNNIDLFALDIIYRSDQLIEGNSLHILAGFNCLKILYL